MKSYKKIIIYSVIYFVIFQFSIIYLIDAETIYDNRVKYDVIKNDPRNMDITLEYIKNTIEKEGLEEYVIMIGDSVGYGTPCPSDMTISSYLEQDMRGSGANIRVFNLAMPAMQTGDMYTVMLRLQENDISLENVILDVTYEGFVERTPDPSPVFWFSEDLKRLDEESYREFEKLIVLNQKVEKNEFKESLAPIKHGIFKNIPVFKYRDYMRVQMLSGIDKHRESLKPWYEKDFLKNLIKQYEYNRGFSDREFDMTNKNPQIYFIDKILDMQKGKNTMVFFCATNRDLLDEYMTEGYMDNIIRVDQYFESKDEIQYMDFNGNVEQNLFSDHIHLLPDGYKMVADTVFEKISGWDILD